MFEWVCVCWTLFIYFSRTGVSELLSWTIQGSYYLHLRTLWDKGAFFLYLNFLRGLLPGQLWPCIRVCICEWLYASVCVCPLSLSLHGCVCVFHFSLCLWVNFSLKRLDWEWYQYCNSSITINILKLIWGRETFSCDIHFPIVSINYV